MILSSDGSGCTVPHNIICWNISQSAGYYSQFAGVLAGFVFVAITLLLTPANLEIFKDPSRKQARTITLQSLFVSFFSLLISSFLFAVIAGEQTTIRAFALGGIASSLFVLSVLQVMLSINWLFKGYGVDRSILTLGWWLYQAVTIIAWLYVIFFFYDLIWVQTENEWEILLYIGLGIGLLGYLVPLVIAMILRKLLATEKLYPSILYCSAALIVVASIIYGILSDLSEAMIRMATTDYIILSSVIILLILSLFFFFYQLSLPRIERREREQLFRQEGADQLASLQSNNADKRQPQNVADQLRPPSPEKSIPRSLGGVAVIGIIIAIGWFVVSVYNKKRYY